jgi:putative ABC transport system permease protein
MSSWLTALRIARREARRAKGRSALVVTLIGLPVLAATSAAVSYDMFTLTAEEELDRELGAADAQLNWVAGDPVQQADVGGEGLFEYEDDQAGPPAHGAEDIRALLPPGSRVTPRWQGEARLAGSPDWVSWQVLDLADPITRGAAYLVDGRAPAAADEVAVTDAVADEHGTGVGGRIELADDGGTYTVVGMVEFPGQPSGTIRFDTPTLGQPVIVFHPDGQPAEAWGVRWLVDTPEPVGWEQVQALNQHGILVFSRAVALDPPAELVERSGAISIMANVPTFGVGAVIGGLAALEIVLLAGPAFAVGARRRRRELALIAASGGTNAQQRRIVLADGVVLGALGAAAGIGLGVVSAFAARPLVEQYLVDARAGGYRVFPLALAGIAAFAVGTGLLAALVPAVTAARQQVVDALAGRRGITRTRKRWPALGAVMILLGAATAGLGAWRVTTNAVLAGLVLGQLGLVLCTPALVGLVARLGSRLPLTPRIALRDAARNRSAAAPAISAVMAAVAGSVAAGVVMLALDDRVTITHVEFRPGTAVVNLWEGPEATADPAAVEQAARATLPVADIYEQRQALCPPDEVLECGMLVTQLAPEAVCPYWDLLDSGPLSPEQQRDAARDPRCGGWVGPPLGFSTVVDDGSGLAALLAADPSALTEAARVLRDGGAVVTEERFLASDGTVTIGLLDAGDRTYAVAEDGRISVPGYVIDADLPRDGAIIPPAVAERTGQELRPVNLLVTTTRMPTEAEEDAFVTAMADLGTSGWLDRGPGSEPADAMLILLAVAAGVVALAAAGIATGLAAADRRPDLATLGAVGASPRLRRSLSLSQSGVIAGLGTGLGLVAGLGGAVAVLVGLNQRYADTWPAPDPYPITVPWLNLAVLLAVPLVAMLGAGLLTRSRLPIERRFT